MSDYRRFDNHRGGDRGGYHPRRDYGRRSFGGGGRDSGSRTMFQTTCAQCGDKCEVPFVPKDDRPVYCSNCFEKRGNASPPRNYDRNSSSRRFERGATQSGSFNNGNAELGQKLDQINGKLDKLLNLLTPIAESEKENEEKELEEKLVQELEKELAEEKQAEEVKSPSVEAKKPASKKPVSPKKKKKEAII